MAIPVEKEMGSTSAMPSLWDRHEPAKWQGLALGRTKHKTTSVKGIITLELTATNLTGNTESQNGRGWKGPLLVI